MEEVIFRIFSMMLFVHFAAALLATSPNTIRTDEDSGNLVVDVSPLPAPRPR